MKLLEIDGLSGSREVCKDEGTQAVLRLSYALDVVDRLSV